MSGILSTEIPVVQAGGGKRPPRTVTVALAGCGVVGGELVRLLARRADELERTHGLRFRLTRVLVRDDHRARPAELPDGVLTTALDEFLASDAELVVEAISGTDPAARIAEAALARGARLVTANKAVVALHGPRLARLARRKGGRLDFEAAAAGSVPVVRALRDSLAPAGVRAVRGVLNGTTNFILTRLADGWRYADALAEAQARGFAEQDPSRDVSGQDAADKLRILAWLAFGADPARLHVRRRGIVPFADRLARDAAWAGGVPRLVAEAARDADGHVTASVEPAIVSALSDLGRARDEENVVTVESAWGGAIRLSGPGAGGAATASALLADMLRGAQRLPGVLPAAGDGAADRREHRWAVSVSGPGADGAVVQRTLDRVALGADRPERVAGDLVFATAPAPWGRVELLCRGLGALGGQPVAQRLEVEPAAAEAAEAA